MTWGISAARHATTAELCRANDKGETIAAHPYKMRQHGPHSTRLVRQNTSAQQPIDFRA